MIFQIYIYLITGENTVRQMKKTLMAIQITVGHQSIFYIYFTSTLSHRHCAYISNYNVADDNPLNLINYAELMYSRKSGRTVIRLLVAGSLTLMTLLQSPAATSFGINFLQTILKAEINRYLINLNFNLYQLNKFIHLNFVLTPLLTGVKITNIQKKTINFQINSPGAIKRLMEPLL